MKLITRRYAAEKTVWYYDEFMTVDTETSHSEHYTWLSSIQVLFNNEYHLFRTPKEFISYLNFLIYDLNLYSNRRVMMIIHNASYDLSYLIGYFQKYLPDKEDRSIIKRDRNNIVAYRQGGIDIRDTFALCNCSLEKWGKDLNVEHQKKVGLYNYDKVIYQDTELTEDEKQYDMFDVLSLSECFKKQLDINNDTICTVPYTSTGYVRRDAERYARKDKYYRKRYFIQNQLDLEQFDMCVEAFAGGFTHNNRFHNDHVVKGLIGHSDFRSEYPSELRNYPLPLGRPEWFYDITDPDNCSLTQYQDLDYILDMYPEYSTLIELRITRAIVKDRKKITMPFMQRSKLHETSKEFCLCDNGRILSFKGEASMTVDNHLLKILLDQYDIDCDVMRVLGFKNEYLPQCLCDLIDYYFKAKSDLKNIHKQYEKELGEMHPRTIEAGINLMMAKARLNGIYGMFVQNPLATSYDIDYDCEDPLIVNSVAEMTDDERAALLESYYKNHRKVLPYQVGVFCTALARKELYEYLIECIGYENALYCDTDSIFYIKTPEIDERIKMKNEEKQQLAEKNHAYIITDTGKKIYYDCFESESDLKAFKGLHSKCYAYITQDDEFKATIAGVPARTIIAMNGDKPIYLTREEELSEITKDIKLSGECSIDIWKAINNLEEHFYFDTNTGTTCNYDDYMLHDEITVEINGHTINTFGGCLIKKLEAKQIKNMSGLADVRRFDGLPDDSDYIM